VLTITLVQLPVPPSTALCPTGNVALAAGCLASAVRVSGLAEHLDVRLLSPFETDLLGDTLLATRIANEEPDILGLSLYLWNTERSLHLGREVKRRSPKTTVIVGGPEVTPDNRFVLDQPGFDFAVAGEAEESFVDLLRSILEGRDAVGLPGVSVRGPQGMSGFGAPTRASFPLKRYPSPYLTGVLRVEPERSCYVETARGCRSRCSYCCYPRSSPSVRTLPVPLALQLFRRLQAEGAREVVFLDPTFNHRPDLIPLLEGLAAIHRDRSLHLFAEVRAEGLTAKVADRLAAAGFRKVEIGLQSVTREALVRSRRGGSPERVACAARLLEERGIRVAVDLIAGLPGDRSADVARAVEFLCERGLDAEAQVFPLSVLPGSQIRADAPKLGLTYDPAPPYYLRQSPWMEGSELAETLLAAERRLGRRFTEQPRLLLARREETSGAPDVFSVDLDWPGAAQLEAAAQPGASHVALWLRGRDLHGARGIARQVIEARFRVDPHAVLDVILCPRSPFPLDLLDFLQGILDRAPSSYLVRSLAWRGENAQRRIGVVLPQGVKVPQDWLEALLARVPVFRDQSLARAIEDAPRLGADLPAARIVDAQEGVPDDAWCELERRADPAAVSFESRSLEAAWVREVLGYREVDE
jgi:radical SAM superfamily enzyme YgiQ (UPF0313 family)